MSSILREILAKNISELRLFKQLYQEELIERGNGNGPIDNIEKIAKGSDVDPSVSLEEQQ